MPCLCLILIQNRTKLDSRAQKCIFLGYRQGTKGYLLFDLLSHDVFISRHAIFYESTFPYQSPTHAAAPIHDTCTDLSPFMFDIPVSTIHAHTAETEPTTYKEASKSQQWIQAMTAKLDAL